jgi:mRNA-degrading endonuclease RelE of RelBE toxin-antitoxin system
VDSNTKDFLKQLNETKSFKKKIDLCNQNLQKLGVGSSRIVYDLGDNKVLKLAKNAKGLAQNSVEWDMYKYSGEIELLNITYECADDDSYVIAEKANKITKNKFVQLTHIPNIKDIYELRDVLNNCLRVYFYPRNSYPNLTDEQVAYYNDLLENNDFISSLVTLINDFRIQLNDLLRPANLGIINENGKEKLVIIDYGFNDDVARNSYGYKNVGMYENLNESNIVSEVSLSLINEIPKGNTFHDKYTPSYYNELKKDIQANGIKEPITLKYYYETNTLELGEGHHRLQIANELNLKTIPVQIKVIYKGKINTTSLKSFDKNKIFQAPIKLDIEKYEKRNYFPTYINPSEIGLIQNLNENKYMNTNKQKLSQLIESVVKEELKKVLKEQQEEQLSSQLEDDFLSLISNLNEEYESELDYKDIAEDIKIIKEPKQILNFISKHIKGSYNLIKSYMSKGMSVALIASILGGTIQSCAVSGGCKQRGSFSNFQKSKPGKKMSNKRHTRPQGW